MKTLAFVSIALGLLVWSSSHNFAQAETWRSVTSAQFGVRFAVPDAKKCKSRTRGDLAGMYCDYGDMKVAAIAAKGAVSFADLRRATHKYSEIPAKYCKRISAGAGNGYRRYEAWACTSGSQSLVGLIGQSGKRAMSHVVFIYGSHAAWKRNRRYVRAFVSSINAL